MNDLRKAAEMALEALEWNYGTDLENIENCTAWLDKMNATIPALRQALAQPEREWVGLNSFDRTLLRTTYAPLKPLHHIKDTDTDTVAEVVIDWEAFFTAIEQALKDKNT
jgi:hypothetical protein